MLVVQTEAKLGCIAGMSSYPAKMSNFHPTKSLALISRVHCIDIRDLDSPNSQIPTKSALFKRMCSLLHVSRMIGRSRKCREAIRIRKPLEFPHNNAPFPIRLQIVVYRSNVPSAIMLVKTSALSHSPAVSYRIAMRDHSVSDGAKTAVSHRARSPQCFLIG